MLINKELITNSHVLPPITGKLSKERLIIKYQYIIIFQAKNIIALPSVIFF